jgi:prepilin-type N-terminal cleavage/methylation domain-containing protein
MKKSKKKLKGMTLIEMIIAIAIFGIMGGLLILVGMHIDATTRAGNNLKYKVATESPYAANHLKTFTDGVDDKDIPTSEIDVKVKLTIPDEVKIWQKQEDKVTHEMKEVELTYSGDVEVDMKADKYETEAVITKDMSSDEIELMRQRANGGLNLEFFEIKPTEPTT